MNAKISFVLLPIVAALVIGGVFAALYFFGNTSRPIVDAAGIIIPPPPADDSADTKAEVAVLLDNKHARATEVVATIQNEASFDAVQIGPYSMSIYRDGKTLPELASLLAYSLPELNRVLAIKKAEFNRTRPSVLEPTIEPVGAVPHSSSYPGDYATQANFVARVLSYLDPANSNDYRSYAAEISVRQEIAGIQYPLDNIAGAVLAEQFFKAILNDPAFAAKIETAKAEWQAAGISQNQGIPQETTL